MVHDDLDEKTRELRAVLIQLLRQLDVSDPDIRLPDLREQVETVLRRLDEDMYRSSPATALAKFERLRELQPHIAQIDERWTEIRRAAGLEAAEEILRNEAPSEGDIPVAWHQRWQDWSPFALAERRDLEQQAVESAARSQFERTSRWGPMSDVMVTALDLRYVAGFPLARIADLLNVSPTAIQLRLADFEREVACRIVQDSLKGQVPVNYSLSRVGPSELLLRSTPSVDKKSRSDRIVIEVVSAWEDREISTGRQKEMVSARVRRPLKFEPTSTIWAVVFASGPRVVLLTEQELSERGVSRISPTRIVESALEFGHESLSSVVPELKGQPVQTQLELNTHPQQDAEKF